MLLFLSNLTVLRVFEIVLKQLFLALHGYVPAILWVVFLFLLVFVYVFIDFAFCIVRTGVYVRSRDRSDFCGPLFVHLLVDGTLPTLRQGCVFCLWCSEVFLRRFGCLFRVNWVWLRVLHHPLHGVILLCVPQTHITSIYFVFCYVFSKSQLFSRFEQNNSSLFFSCWNVVITYI